MLPALQLVPSNSALNNEVWTVLRQFPYEARYRMYAHWKVSGDWVVDIC